MEREKLLAKESQRELVAHCGLIDPLACGRSPEVISFLHLPPGGQTYCAIHIYCSGFVPTERTKRNIREEIFF